MIYCFKIELLLTFIDRYQLWVQIDLIYIFAYCSFQGWFVYSHILIEIRRLFTFISVDTGMEILTPWSSQVHLEAQPKGIQAIEGCYNLHIDQSWTFYEVNMLYMDLLGLYWPKIYVMYYSCHWKWNINTSLFYCLRTQ